MSAQEVMRASFAAQRPYRDCITATERIDRLLETGAFEWKRYPFPLLDAAALWLLVRLDEVLTAADDAGMRIDFAVPMKPVLDNDTKQPKPADVTTLARQVRNGLTHSESPRNKVPFGRMVGLDFNKPEAGELTFAIGEFSLLLNAHVRRALAELRARAEAELTLLRTSMEADLAAARAVS